MTDVWIKTMPISSSGTVKYFYAEKIRHLNVNISSAGQFACSTAFDADEKTFYYVYINSEFTIYHIPYYDEKTDYITPVVQWINKAKKIASETDEAIILDFNKDFDNPIVK